MSVSIGQDSTILYVVDEDISSFPTVKFIVRDREGNRVELPKARLVFETYGDTCGITANLTETETGMFTEGALQVQIIATDGEGNDYKTAPEYTLTTHLL